MLTLMVGLQWQKLHRSHSSVVVEVKKVAEVSIALNHQYNNVKLIFLIKLIE